MPHARRRGGTSHGERCPGVGLEYGGDVLGRRSTTGIHNADTEPSAGLAANGPFLGETIGNGESARAWIAEQTGAELAIDIKSTAADPSDPGPGSGASWRRSCGAAQ